MADRDYQSRTFDLIRQSVMRGHRRILVVLPTGGGKGYMAARVQQQCAEKGNPNIFFADQRELVLQLGRQLDRMDVAHTKLMAGVKNEYGSFEDVQAGMLSVVAAKDTLWARAFKTDKIKPPPAKVIQIDEAHKSLAHTWQSVAKHYEDSIVIGWTATPCRSDGRGLGDFYQTMIQAATYKELQEAGYLVPVRVFAPDHPDLKGLKVSRGDYSKRSLEQRMNRDQMVGNIVDEWKRNSDGRSTVCFASGVQHSIHIRNQFRLHGVTCEHIDGKMEQDERDDIIGRANDGLIDVVTNYGVLHTGVDVPRWKYLICARPTKSFSLWRQMGGRAQRPFQDYKDCVIQDHSDNALHFGFPDEDVDWSLDTKRKAQEYHKKQKQEQKKKDPYACEKCQTVYRGPHCPSCGYVPDRKGKEVKMTQGELAELQRKKRNRSATKTEKQKEWDNALGIAMRRGAKVGMAAGIYKSKFGVLPRGLQNMPVSSQWQMPAKQFYREVVKPAKEAAKREFEMVEF